MTVGTDGDPGPSCEIRMGAMGDCTEPLPVRPRHPPRPLRMPAPRPCPSLNSTRMVGSFEHQGCWRVGSRREARAARALRRERSRSSRLTASTRDALTNVHARLLVHEGWSRPCPRFDRGPSFRSQDRTVTLRDTRSCPRGPRRLHRDVRLSDVAADPPRPQSPRAHRPARRACVGTCLLDARRRRLSLPAPKCRALCPGPALGSSLGPRSAGASPVCVSPSLRSVSLSDGARQSPPRTTSATRLGPGCRGAMQG